LPFNDIILQKIKKEVGGLCSRRTPAHLKDQLRFEYEIEKQNVIIYEIRPMWNNPNEITKLTVAKLTYVISKNIWKLYWQRANGKWLKYGTSKPTVDLGDLVQEIDDDIYGCFFG
jgi:hypothetical protein